MKYLKLKKQVKNIKQIRYFCKISQKDFAKHSSTTVQTISKWESENYQKVPINQLINIMKYISTKYNNPEFVDSIKYIVKICQNFKRIREINNVTQCELGIICGVTPQTIWRWEDNNYQNITFESFCLILEFMESKYVKNNTSNI